MHTSVTLMSFALYFRILNRQRVASHFTVFSSTLSPLFLPIFPLLFSLTGVYLSSLCLYHTAAYIYIRIIGLYLFSTVTYSERRCGGEAIFARIITHSLVLPLILPADPNSPISTPVLSSFPSLLSAPLIQGALTIALA